MTDTSANGDSQAEVMAFLAAPGSLSGTLGESGPIQRIDTHGAIVFLAGARAWKLKRAIKYPYMDFSTPERRRAYCEAELTLNRRTAPSLYRRVVAVTRAADGRLALAGDGAPVDWLVEMNRFAEDALFDRLAASAKLDVALIEGAAAAVAALHDAAARRPEAGGAGVLERVIVNSDAELNSGAATTLDAAAIARLRARSLAELDRRRELIEARRRAGFVRQVHGDLHLGNIVLIDGKPVLFDGIEFNDEFSLIDTCYDFAFLVMDLLHRDLAALANAALNRYVALSGDYGGLALLPLFLSLRAAIRAHVSLSMARVQPQPDAAASLRRSAARYLDRARDFLQPATPVLIGIGGLSGSGKSTLARALAPEIGPAPGALVLRSDLVRKELFGVAPTTRLGSDAYDRAATARVYAELNRRGHMTLAAGHGVIVDAVHALPAERVALENLARAAGIGFVGLWLEAPVAAMAARLDARQGDASDATVAVLERQLDYDLGALNWARIDAGGEANATLAAARGLLSDVIPRSAICRKMSPP